MAIAIEWARALAARTPQFVLAELVFGGAALCLLGTLFSLDELGLSRRRLGLKVLGGVALGAVLIAPAALRSAPLPQLPAQFAAAAVIVSIGEEVAFRGAVFAVLRAAGGAPVAVAGSTVLFTVAHVLSHPAAFLLPVFAVGLLFGLWRWAFDDLVGPVAGHVIADLSL